MEDLIADGRVGLLAAARRFDPKRGFSFEWYASFRVRGAILDAVRTYLAPSAYGRFLSYVAQGAKRSKSRTPPNTFDRPHRRRILNLDATLAGMSAVGPLGVVVEVTDYEEEDLVDRERLDPEQELASVQLRKLLFRSIRTLPPREAELVRRHYFNDEGLDQVALDLEINKSWASRLHIRGIKRLSKRVRGGG